MTCACGEPVGDSPLSDMCRVCVALWAEATKPEPVKAVAHLNFGNGRGSWVEIGQVTE